jgi:ABC-2 type transport system ATP-binding protein
MIKIENLSKIYKIHRIFEGLNIKKEKSVTALNDVSFTIDNNKIIGLLGPNGAGKTTLLKILTNILLPECGEIEFNGIKLSQNPDYFKNNSGIVNSEERSFYWRLSVLENLRFFMGIFQDKPDEDKILEILGLLGIENIKNRPFRMLSSGMKAKIQIARVLLKLPKLLVLDEPFSNIDFNSREEIKAFLLKWVKEEDRMIIITSHHWEEIIEWIDEAVLIDQGQIVGKQKKIEGKKYIRICYKSGIEKRIPLNDVKESIVIDPDFTSIEVENEMLTDIIKRLKK